MIQEILNRDFVIGALAAVRDELSDDRRSIPEDFEGDLDETDLDAAHQAIEEALAQEEIAPSGQSAQQPEGEDRRGPSGTSLDEAVFIARDQTISLFQSALEDYYEDREVEIVAIDGTCSSRTFESGRRHTHGRGPP